MVLYMQLPLEGQPFRKFGMLHCVLNTTAKNLDLITRLGLAKDRRTRCARFPSLKFPDVRTYDSSFETLYIPLSIKIQSPAKETDSYLTSVFTCIIITVKVTFF